MVAAKHPTVRARRNDPRRGFRVLDGAGSALPAPEWPLRPNVDLLAAIKAAEGQVEAAQAATGPMAAANLTKAETKLARLRLQAEVWAEAEQALWVEAWGWPQAVVWRETRSERVLALWCRLQVQAEDGVRSAVAEARQYGDRLGLTPQALTRLQLETEHLDQAQDETAARRAKRTDWEERAARAVAAYKAPRPEDPGSVRALFAV
jgi:hypothetical protein